MNMEFWRHRMMILVLLLALVIVSTALAAGAWGHTGMLSQGSAPGAITYQTLRVYGRDGEGAGQPVTDTLTSRLAEDPPYTDPVDVFNPQRPQAPRKDSVTWNPVWMSEIHTRDENWAKGLYQKLVANGINASEKVWFRMWYEPEHWDKDLNANDRLDRNEKGEPVAPSNPEPTSIDEWYPAIMQEFTYLLMELRTTINRSVKPEPIYGRAGETQFVFPIGMRQADLFDPYGYGLTSLDANFDGIPDIVHVESERTLFDKTGIAADFDGDSLIDPLDVDGLPLSGDELVVLRTEGEDLAVGGRLQFLDHMIQVREVFDDSVIVDIYYTGHKTPRWIDRPTLYLRDMALAGTSGPAQLIQAVQNGGSGTNVCNFPTGPWFVYLNFVDTAERTVNLMVGRALGATYSAMEQGPGAQDRTPGDPWFLKRFYVDGHEYNVVAIHTRFGRADPFPSNQTTPPTVCNVRDFQGDPTDTTEFQFITIRTPVPKVPVIIEQHSVYLQEYLEEDPLSVMPPYNYEHYIFEDVQAITEFDDNLADVAFIGKLVGPVPPILQRNGPVPYQGVGPFSPYSDPRELYLFYVREEEDPQFLGELKEKYGDILPQEPELEFWYVEQWWTLPWEYTEFIFPDIRPEITNASSTWDPNGTAPDPDLYLLTSAFTAHQNWHRLWTQGDIISQQIGEGRVKFWFDPAPNPAEPGKKYKDDEGIRVYGMDLPEDAPNSLATLWEGSAGDPLGVMTDTVVSRVGSQVITNTVLVEIPPYTDPWAPFNPQLPQAPRKDSLTFNPAYMDQFLHGDEPISPLYRQISVEEQDAREKVYFRAWFEPNFLDKILRHAPVAVSTLPEEELNNECVSANSILADVQRLGAIVPVGDFDFYVFILYKPQWVVIETTPGPTGDDVTDDTTLALWRHDPATCGLGIDPSDPNWQAIAWDDDSGPGNQAMIRRYLDAGTYYVRVGDSGNDSLIPDYIVRLVLDDPVQEAYHFPAVMEEFTYILLDTRDQPWHGQPGTSRLAFPMATGVTELPAPGPGDTIATPSFGYGLTTFDANFDTNPDIVTIHSENSLFGATGIRADFDGDGVIDYLDTDGLELTGDELVVFTVDSVTLRRGQSAQFLDHMVTLENVASNSQVQLQFWYTGGGLHPSGSGYSLHPDKIGGARTLNLRDMAVAYKTAVRIIPQGGNNLGRLDGPWFAYLKAINTSTETVALTIGRALGATHTAMDDGNGQHDLTPGDPWWLKRFFVDGHEYNVVALKTVPAEFMAPGDEPYEFKYITIRTPVPKVNFVNYQDSQKLEGYHLGLVWGVDTNVISVMPPFNMRHTRRDDIQRLTEVDFANPDAYDEDCIGPVMPNVPPLTIRIVGQDHEPQFFGELKEKFWNLPEPVQYGSNDRWATEQFHTLPDHYTDLQLPAGQLYLLTSSWLSDQSWSHYHACADLSTEPGVQNTQDDLYGIHPDIPATNATRINDPGDPDDDTRYYDAALGARPLRVKFWYDPRDPHDLYVNTWALTPPPTSTPTLTPTNTPATPQPTATWTPIPPTPTNTPITPSPTPTNTPLPRPNPPSTMTASSISQSAVRLQWTDNSTDETSFYVERSPNGSTGWELIAIVPGVPGTGNTVSYTDTGLTPGTWYFYRVRAYRASDGAFSAYSGVEGVQTLPISQGVSGTVLLQGRTNHSGASVNVDGQFYATTGTDGRFAIQNVTAGTHTLSASMPRYLGAVKSIEVQAGSVKDAGQITLLGGDVNSDNVINLFDLVIVGGVYDTTPPADARADINGDNTVNIFDLVLVGGNYDAVGPSIWPAVAAVPRLTAPDTGARMVLTAEKTVLDVGDTVTVTVYLTDVRNLYAAELNVQFDPAVLQVVDADPIRSCNPPRPTCVQIGVGNFPVSPDDLAAGTGFVAKNEADNQTGRIVYAVGRLNPAPAVDGEGVLARITFQAIGSGRSNLALDGILSDREAASIPFTPETIEAIYVRYRIYLPVVGR